MKDYLFVVTGSIACNKAIDAARAVDASVILTESAMKLVDESLLHGLDVISNEFDWDGFKHLDLAKDFKKMVVCPASANSIARLANGICDDLWTTAFLKFDPRDVFVFPAMNSAMFLHPSVQQNLYTLRSFGVNVVDPTMGELACGEEGVGRLPESEDIVFKIKSKSKRDFFGKKVLVNAGATREYIDSVRFISNGGSGQTGLLIADYFYSLGADVSLVTTGAGVKRAYEVVEVVSAQDMYEACLERFSECDLFVGSAAVGDIKSKIESKSKVKKEELGDVIEVEVTVDVLAELGKVKDHQVIVGFALFDKGLTDDEVLSMLKVKFKVKNCDLVIGNNLSNFGETSEELDYSVYDGSSLRSVRSRKRDLGSVIFDEVVEKL